MQHIKQFSGTALAKALASFSLAIVLAVGHAPQAKAADLDACFKALNSNQPVQAVQEAQTLLKQQSQSQESVFYANLCLGRGWYKQGELNKALPPLQNAAQLANDPRTRNAANSWLGMTLIGLGELDAAKAAHRIELATAEELGNASMQAMALNNLGVIAINQKKYNEALSLFTQALTKHSAEEDKSFNLNNIASVYMKMGNYASAKETIQQAIIIQRKYARSDLGLSLLNLGEINRNIGNLPEANRYLNEGLELSKGKNLLYEGMAYRLLGSVSYNSGDNEQARKQFELALKIFQEIGAKSNAEEVETELGNMQIKMNLERWFRYALGASLVIALLLFYTSRRYPKENSNNPFLFSKSGLARSMRVVTILLPALIFAALAGVTDGDFMSPLIRGIEGLTMIVVAMVAGKAEGK